MLKWRGNQIEVTPPKRPKKITGTHLPEVLGVNPYVSPFEAWCRCTRTYKEPIEGNEYTLAGQVIEPKVFEFLRTSMGFGKRVVVPEDVYGKDHFSRTYGDFFPDTPIFGGSWDGLITRDGSDEIEYVVEVKTVQTDGHAGTLEQRWKDGKAPHYQALQASLYAYLLGVDDVLMVGVALARKNGDYDHPEQVTPSYANENVYIDMFKVSERYPNFPELIESVKQWWNTYVLTGLSPVWDEKKDANILTALRQNHVDAGGDIQAILAEAEQLQKEIDEIYSKAADREKRLKALTDAIKENLAGQFREGDTHVVMKGNSYEWKYARTESQKIDEKALKADGLFDKYAKPAVSYRLTKSEIK